MNEAHPERNSESTAKDKGISRRNLITGAAGAAVVLGMGGAVRVVGGTVPLRPPGGQDESRFIGTCIRCDRCRSICPRHAIKGCGIEDGIINMRTPKLNYRIGRITSGYTRLHEAATPYEGLLDAEGNGYCDFCNLCIENCPTGALSDFDPESAWIGVAAVVPNLCIAFDKLGGCRKCVDYCAFDAITLDEAKRPVVHPEKCNGCGVCENICPSSSYRTFTSRSRRGINVNVDEQGRPQ
jgi:ferredoxin-type protein NapG